MIQCGEDLTKANEGCVLSARPDAKGRWAIGYGHDIAPSPGLRWTQQQAEDAFTVDYALAGQRARSDIGVVFFGRLSPQRQAVLNDMAYEVGGAGLYQFSHMLTAMRTGNWPAASNYLKSSLLFTQVPQRETRNIQILLTGEWPDEASANASA